MLEHLESLLHLGAGGEGTVELVWDGAGRRLLAVKIIRLLPDTKAQGPRIVERLAPFVKARADSPVLPVLACGLAEDAPQLFRQRFGITQRAAVYVVMPYFHGMAADALRGHELLGACEVACIGAQVADALERLHAMGLVHGDVKPGNVLVNEQGRCVLVDPQLGGGRTTPAYEAPELQGGGGGGDASADWFALGRTLLALWIGAEPDSRPGLLQRPPNVQPSQSGPRRLAHEQLALLIDKLSHPNPRERATSPAAELSALARALGASDLQLPLAAQVSGRERPRLREIELLERQHRALRGGDMRESRGRRWPKFLLVGLLVLGGAWISWVVALGVFSDGALLHRVDDAGARFLPPVDSAHAAVDLGADGRPADGGCLFTYLVKHPAERLDVKSVKGPVLWREDHPQLGHLYRLALPAGDYFLEHLHPGNHLEQRALSLKPGDPSRWESVEYDLGAPRWHFPCGDDGSCDGVGFTCCPRYCADLKRDRDDCGACGRQCLDTEDCRDGACQAAADTRHLGVRKRFVDPKIVADRLRPFAAQKLGLEMDGHTEDSMGLSEDIGRALQNFREPAAAAQWSVTPCNYQDNTNSLPGLLVELRAGADAPTRRAATALVEALRACHLEVVGPVARTARTGLGSGDCHEPRALVLTISDVP